MCGIAGIVSDDPRLRDERTLRAMADALRHRGPDEEGVGVSAPAALAARRLAIIDLAHGQQPMRNETGDVLAVQNGEIYNFVELRRELASLGHVFRTDNDTETLPHAYEEWGPKFASRLHGMFAIAIWDARRERLILARDRFGKKPLFYSASARLTVFASELQGLLAHSAIEAAPDAEAIDDYLTLGYVPAPRSAYVGIRKVEPAHTVVIERGHVTSERYWRLSYSPKLDVAIDQAAERVRELIDAAVRRRLMSDVPLGAFLSGGLDSSTVVAFMARHSERPVKTFSIGFADARFDELRYARIVARAFGTDHHEFVVDAAQTDVLPMLVRHLGEPFADSSIVPTYHVARITREHVTVVLNGDGGDELFAGYDRYKAAALARATVERLPDGARRGVAALAERLPGRSFLPRPALRARRFLVALGLEPEDRYLRWTGYFTGPLRERIAGPALRDRVDGRADGPLRDASLLTGATEPAERFMAADIALGLPGDLLVKMDIATMACSLEARSPLLDHELAEYVARLPVGYKLSIGRSKVLLRQAMRGVLPEAILRRGKMGFSAPVGEWLRGPLRELFSDLVLATDARSRAFVSLTGARDLYAEHVSGRVDRTPWLWNLLMLELWWRECVDGRRIATPGPYPLAVGGPS